MNKLIVLLGFIILPVTIYCQTNFKAGFIITNENDTVYGWVDYRTDKMNAEACRFKETENALVQTYYPGYIKGYRFTEEGKFYLSKEVEFNNSSRRIFLEFMVQGIMNLYRYDFGKDVCYYFEKEPGLLVPVSRRQAESIDMEQKIYQRNDIRYKNVLWYMFKDTERAAGQSTKTSFDSKSMMNLAKMYHDEVCTTGEECIVFEENPDKKFTKFKFSVYGGLRFNQYILDKKRELPAMEDNFSMSPTIGVQANISVPRWVISLSLQADISLSSFNKTADYRKIVDRYKYESILMAIKLGGKYTHPTGKWRPTVEGNFIYLNTFDRKASLKRTQPMGNASKYSDYQLPFGYMFGADVGIGADYYFERENAIFFRLSYEYFWWNPDGFIDGISYKDKMHGIVLKAGYTF